MLIFIVSCWLVTSVTPTKKCDTCSVIHAVGFSLTPVGFRVSVVVRGLEGLEGEGGKPILIFVNSMVYKL